MHFAPLKRHFAHFGAALGQKVLKYDGNKLHYEGVNIMKKTISAITAAIIAICMLFSLTGCGDSAKKQEAIDAFNQTSTVFDETANLINANADKIDDEVISTFQQMSELLSQYKDILEGDSEIEDDKYDEMIEWFGTAESWISDAKAEIETALADVQ